MRFSFKITQKNKSSILIYNRAAGVPVFQTLLFSKCCITVPIVAKSHGKTLFLV